MCLDHIPGISSLELWTGSARCCQVARRAPSKAEDRHEKPKHLQKGWPNTYKQRFFQNGIDEEKDDDDDDDDDDDYDDYDDADADDAGDDMSICFQVSKCSILVVSYYKIILGRWPSIFVNHVFIILVHKKN